MRWACKYTGTQHGLSDRQGERRVIIKFLFWPRNFDGEQRWLEFCAIVESLEPYVHGGWEWREIAYARYPEEKLSPTIAAKCCQELVTVNE